MDANANLPNTSVSADTAPLPGAVSGTDQLLYDTVADTPPTTIADVLSRMQQIDALLPSNDGLKWFNRMYLMVTQQVDLHPPGGAWQSPLWLTRLDVVFACLYFGAVRDYVSGKTVSSAWSALLDARERVGVDRIQFALAGMNAHINHDLALALLETNSELGMTPSLNGPEHTDYLSVNELLNTLMPETLNMFATDTLGVLAEDTGKIGRLLAFWDICAARNLAWDFAGHLEDLNDVGREVALRTQDAMTGLVGCALLASV